jgi:hypothetical protein
MTRTMSRSTSRSKPRLGAALLAGTALAVSSLAVATTADATPNGTDLEATVLRISGAAVTGGAAVPSGRTLTPVNLTTTDPETFAGDGIRFGVFRPAYRINGARVPAQPAEQVTFRINGSVVATVVPEMRYTELQTNGGTLPAVLFTASGATYAFPLGTIGASTRTVARSTVRSPAISFLPAVHGLLPVGAQTRVGTVFGQSTTSGVPTGTGSTGRYTVLDADNIRRNADTLSEEWMFPGEPMPRYTRQQPALESLGLEVRATVSLRNGGTATVRGVRFDSVGSFGVGQGSFWLLERAPLAAAGATIADVTAVLSQTPFGHDLTWDELGFELVG